jgi:hypothetical protein
MKQVSSIFEYFLSVFSRNRDPMDKVNDDLYLSLVAKNKCHY